MHRALQVQWITSERILDTARVSGSILQVSTPLPFKLLAHAGSRRRPALRESA